MHCRYCDDNAHEWFVVWKVSEIRFDDVVNSFFHLQQLAFCFSTDLSRVSHKRMSDDQDIDISIDADEPQVRQVDCALQLKVEGNKVSSIFVLLLFLSFGFVILFTSSDIILSPFWLMLTPSSIMSSNINSSRNNSNKHNHKTNNLQNTVDGHQSKFNNIMPNNMRAILDMITLNINKMEVEPETEKTKNQYVDTI